MSLESLLIPFPWNQYSSKVAARICRPRNGGIFTLDEASERSARWVCSQEGSEKEGNVVSFYALVDPNDGVIIDCRFQVIGNSALIAAADVACDLVAGKNYDQSRRITTELIDKELRVSSSLPAFPETVVGFLEMAVMAVHQFAEQCSDIPLSPEYVSPPIPQDIGEILEGGYPGFDELPLKKKIAVIEEVLDSDVRPYIALDGGGVEVMDIVKGRQVVIAYQGACTSCFSAVGATLSYIKKVLTAKVHPDIDVIPQMEY